MKIAEKNKIISFSKKINIHKIGFAKAYYDYNRLSEYSKRKEKKLQCPLEINNNLEEMLEPSYWLENAKSIIVIMEGYELLDSNENNAVITGRVSGASIYRDYHKVVLEKLNRLKEFIDKEYNCDSISICDSNTFSDRSFALNAGLGQLGKNSFIINEELGSSTYIGYLISDIEIDSYDSYISKDICSGCNLCVELCPNGAIVENNQINSNKCISYLTQAKTLSEEDKTLLHNAFYGCDICQRVCPYNNTSSDFYRNDYKFAEQIISAEVPIKKIFEISNKDFKSTFGVSSSGWIGKKRMQRNAIIALGNNGSDQAKQILQEILNTNPSEDITKEIISSLNRIIKNRYNK